MVLADGFLKDVVYRPRVNLPASVWMSKPAYVGKGLAKMPPFTSPFSFEKLTKQK
jgi:hypothetical protein